MKTTTTPAIKFTSEGMEGFDEFDRWATVNVPQWRDIRNYQAMTGNSQAECYRFLACYMTIQFLQSQDQLISLVEKTGVTP